MTENQKSCVEQNLQLQHVIYRTRQKYGSGTNFMLIFNKDLQTKIAQNPNRAYLGSAPSLNIVRQSYSNQLLIVWIMAQLEDINDFVSIKQKMTIDQMEQTASIIANEYGYLKVSEFHLFLHRFKAGRYGTFYGCIDPLQLTQGLVQFLEQRRIEITKLEQQNNQLKIDRQRKEWASIAVSRQEYEQLKKEHKYETRK